MYRLREYEAADLSAIERELPVYADSVRAIRAHPGGLYGVMVHDPRDRIAGCMVAVRSELATNTRTIGLGIMRIAHVAQSARIGGIHSMFMELDGAFADRFEGPDRVFQAMISQWDEADVWCMRKLRDYEPISQCLTFAGSVVPHEPPAGVTITKIRAEQLAEPGTLSFDTGPTAGVRRTAAMLLHGAQQAGRDAWLARRGEQVLGWAVVAAEGGQIVLEDHWIDWHDAPLAAAMLAAIVGSGRPLRVTRWTNQEAEIAALQAAGLTIRGPEHLVAARVSAFGIAPASLAEFASLGEVDVGAAPLPRLSRNERITTPPPPGTQSTKGDHRRSSSNRKVQSR